MKFRLIKTFILLVAFATVAAGQRTATAEQVAPSRLGQTNVQTVEYCRLMRNPDAYVGKWIRVQATFKNLISLESILHRQCKPEVLPISVGFPTLNGEVLWPEFLSKMNAERIDSANITAVGRFLGPRKPDGKFNYGHYGWSRYLFEIHTIEKLRPVSGKK